MAREIKGKAEAAEAAWKEWKATTEAEAAEAAEAKAADAADAAAWATWNAEAKAAEAKAAAAEAKAAAAAAKATAAWATWNAAEEAAREGLNPLPNNQRNTKMAQEIKGKAEAIYALLQDELGKPKRQRANEVEEAAEAAWEEAETAWRSIEETEKAWDAGEVVSRYTPRINARAAARRAIAAEMWAEQLKADADEALKDSERAWKVLMDETGSQAVASAAVRAARAELGL